MSAIATDKRPHWACSEKDGQLKCLFQKTGCNKTSCDLWGVVIQWFPVEGVKGRKRFKYIRFMSNFDGDDEEHPDLWEIWWANYDYKKMKWKLIRACTDTGFQLGEQSKLSFPPRALPHGYQQYQVVNDSNSGNLPTGVISF